MYGVTFPKFFKGSVLLVNTLTPSPVLHSQNYFLAFSSDIIFSNKINHGVYNIDTYTDHAFINVSQYIHNNVKHV